MKALDVLGTGVKKARAAVRGLTMPAQPAQQAGGDPFYSDRERREAFEARHRWLGQRRRGWLR